MLQEKLESWRQADKEILVCCCDEKKAEEMWLEAGGKPGNIMSLRQMESWMMTGGSLPKELCFTGSLSAFLHCFPKENIEESKRKANGFLTRCIATYEEGKWAFFSCRAVTASCCMGKYLSIADRKER